MPTFDQIVRYGDTSEAGVGHRLKLIRTARNMSQQAMAEVAGAGLSTYQHHEKGNNYPRPHHVKAWRRKFGADQNFIYRGDYRDLPVGLAKDIEATATGDATY